MARVMALSLKEYEAQVKRNEDEWAAERRIQDATAKAKKYDCVNIQLECLFGRV